VGERLDMAIIWSKEQQTIEALLAERRTELEAIEIELRAYENLQRQAHRGPQMAKWYLENRRLNLQRQVADLEKMLEAR
jgi:hypothetical protein